MNLAEAELATGQADYANEIYSQVLELLDEAEIKATLSPKDHMAQALCLTRLGEPRRAVEIAQRTLQRQPRDPEVAYQAALVYAQVGDLHSALVNAEHALDLGVRSRWFQVPGFESLLADSKFSARLSSVDSG